MAIKIKMPRDLILIKLKENKTDLILPDEAKDRHKFASTCGEAVSVGDECKYVKEGDFVHFKNYIGNELVDDDLGIGTFIIVSEVDILAYK